MLKNSISYLLALSKIEYGVKVYKEISKQFSTTTSLCSNVIFMELFDNFYHLHEERKPFSNIDNKMKFFNFIDSYKREIQNGRKVSLPRILVDISSISNNCEGVLATKIYHTLYDYMPILDSVVAKHFKIKTRNTTNKTLQSKIDFFLKSYNNFLDLFNDYSKSNEGQKILSEFSRKYPNSGLSDTKIIDFILWADR